jgi:hypothetical protein
VKSSPIVTKPILLLVARVGQAPVRSIKQDLNQELVDEFCGAELRPKRSLLQRP